ncbi:hypothetical protein [Sporomusa acidovorans]|uniref:hypothetical protein n=1 Tax=Sporomusa acidovorans TaxID=112900 RepID=UPI000B88EDA0|nr:hypothetical protein [Sporomusa acidovorans]
MEECTCNLSMMADHNAVCKACSQKLMAAANVKSIGNLNGVAIPRDRRDTTIAAEHCTCDTRMMVDHNAMCAACSQEILK